MDDAQGSEALLAYAMNGKALTIQHGDPLRVIVPGWYGMAFVKWLTEIDVIVAASPSITSGQVGGAE